MHGAHWLVPFRFDAPDQLTTASAASTRLRAGACLSAVRKVGSGWQLTVGDAIADSAQVCVVGKIGVSRVQDLGQRWLDDLVRLRDRGGIAVLDYTDNLLAYESTMTAHYRAMLPLVDAAVVSSSSMVSSLRQYFHGRIEVIADAVEVDVMLPRARRSETVTLLWFGQPLNLPYLLEALPFLSSSQMLKLLVMTDQNGQQWLTSQQPKKPGNVSVEIGPWNPSAMRHAATLCDVCIIPSNPADPKKRHVSTNRLVTALALGLPVGADPMPSYLDHREYFADLRGPDFKNMLSDPTTWHERVVRAQRDVVPRYAMPVLGQQWLSLFDALVAQR
jgi:hypothetical protein